MALQFQLFVIVFDSPPILGREAFEVNYKIVINLASKIASKKIEKSNRSRYVKFCETSQNCS